MNILAPMLRILQSGPIFGAVVEVYMDHGCGHSSEGQSVSEGIGHRDVYRKVLLVLAFGKVQVLIHHPRDAIWTACIVEYARGKKRETTASVDHYGFESDNSLLGTTPDIGIV